MSLFGSPRTNVPAPETSLNVQTSLQGVPRAMVWGINKISPNLVWYGDLVATPQKSSGGKGLGGSQTTGYTYRAAVMMGLCEGPATPTGRVWTGSTLTSAEALNISFYPGDYTQMPWGYLTSLHPDQADAYRGLCYAAAGPLDMGSSPSLPSFAFEVVGPTNFPIAGIHDASPDFVVADFLTNPYAGVGFPADRMGYLFDWGQFCVAAGLGISPVLTTQTEARSVLSDWLEACNGGAVWSGGRLNVVALGDVDLAGNGATWAPPSAPAFAWTDADYKKPQGGNPNSKAGSSSADPVQGNRLDPNEVYNAFPVEFADADNGYNGTLVTAQDDASIAAAGRVKPADKKTWHFITHQSIALTAAQMWLARAAAAMVTHAVTVGREWIRVEPGDIGTMTDTILGLNDQWVRVLEITGNADDTLTVHVQEVTFGNGQPATHRTQPSLGFSHDINAVVTARGTVVAWEPTYALAGALEIWVAAAGAGDWASCEIWIGTNDETYTFQTVIEGASRVGALTASLPSVASIGAGLTIDTVHTLAVDMGASAAVVVGATQNDMIEANTVCYVDGEYLSYASATLTGPNDYAIAGLNRGLFGTAPSAHASGAPFVRLAADTFARIPYTTDRVGQTLFIKALGVNAYGGGRQSLDDVTPIAVTVMGLALSGPLPNPTDVSIALVAGLTALQWAAVSDFRNPIYEIRVGASWSSAQVYARVAHSPIYLPTNGTWWVAAYAQPAPSIVVYSTTPVSIVVSSVTRDAENVVGAYDEAATGWTGTLDTGLSVAGAALVTSSGVLEALYTAPSGHIVDAGRAMACNAVANWACAATAGVDVLSNPDWLHSVNILGVPIQAGYTVVPLIAVSPDTGAFGAWQVYTPGSYYGRRFKFGLRVIQTDPTVQVVVSAFSYFVEAPDRRDHYVGLSVASGGTTVTFTPDGRSTSVPFNAGPGGATQPSVTASIVDAVAGDQLVLSAITRSGATVHVTNGGSGVARTVNLEAKGY